MVQAVRAVVSKAYMLVALVLLERMASMHFELALVCMRWIEQVDFAAAERMQYCIDSGWLDRQRELYSSPDLVGWQHRSVDSPHTHFADHCA